MAHTKPHTDKGSGVLIFLDLDGVIADFDAHAVSEGKRRPDGTLDEEALDFKWWAGMPVFPGAREFYEDLKKIGAVKFLTGPKLDPASHGGKASWLKNQFAPHRGKWILNDLIICPGRDKHLLARPGRILVDDRIKNIQDWEAAGGIGILHAGDFDETLKKVRQAAAQIEANRKLQPPKPSGPAPF